MNNFKNELKIVVFIDAFGWEIYKKYGFLNDLLTNQKRVEMQFGYSSAAIPTILTGKSPEEHEHFNLFYYSPTKSPFRYLSWPLQYILPRRIETNWRVRSILSRFFSFLLGYTGYFNLYSTPFEK